MEFGEQRSPGVASGQGGVGGLGRALRRGGPGVAGVEDPDRPPGYVIKVTGRVPGLLKWWVRAVDGRWFEGQLRGV